MKKSLWRLNDKRASSYMKELIKIGKKFWF